MRLLLRRTALTVGSRSSSRAAVAMTTDAAARSSSKAPAQTPAIAMQKSAADGDARSWRPPPPDPAPDLDAAAAAFALSPSAALGLDSAGAAADASRGPRVDHLVVEGGEAGAGLGLGEEDLAAFVARRSAISREHAAALLELGAVWWCPVPPPPPRSHGSFGPDGSDGAEAARAAARERHVEGRGRHGGGSHLFQPRRAGAADRPPAGSYVRVHVRPKRYFHLEADSAAATAEEEQDGEEEMGSEGGGAQEEEEKMPTSTSLARVGYGARAWARRLVATSAEFAVLNKPPCVPSVPTVDNGVEHALSGAAVGIAEVLRRRRRGRGRRGEGGAAGGGAPPPQQQQRPRKRPPRGPQASGAAATGGLAAAHRLDHGASGVLAIGRTPRFVAGFQELSKRGRVAKVYRAALLVTAEAEAEAGAAAETSSSSSPPPPPRRSLPRAGDTLVHWAEVNARPHGAPPRTLMFDGPGSGSSAGGGGGGGDGGEGGPKERARCELRIVSMRRVSLLPSAAEALGVSAVTPGGKEEVWEACILLITGRTHQIRAQMAKVGFPLLGDVLYGTEDYSRVENPNSLERRRRSKADEKERRSNDGGSSVKKDEGRDAAPPPPPPPLPLDRPIALHAARLAASGRHALRVFGRDPAVFDAGAPWWRAGGPGESDEEDRRDLERALELRAEAEAERESSSEEGEGGEGGEEVSVIV